MLFNPLWTKLFKTSADPFLLNELIAWLEEQDPDERYDYKSCGSCLLARYFASHMAHPSVSRNFVQFDVPHPLMMGVRMKQVQLLPEHFNAVAEQRPHTFGAALRRARKAQEAWV